jgi:hypothetical protein
MIGYMVFLERQKYMIEIIKLDFVHKSYYDFYISDIIDFLSSKMSARIIHIWDDNSSLAITLKKNNFIMNKTTDGFGTHSFPVTIYTPQAILHNVDLKNEKNFSLDILTRDFI